MKRSTQNRDTDGRSRPSRRPGQGSATARTPSGPTAALHRTRGNQGVQSLAKGGDEREQSNRPDGMCSRCLQRYRAGKPLNCTECEQTLAAGGPGPTVRGSPGEGTVQPKLEVSDPDDEFEREAERVADRVMRTADPGVGVPGAGSADGIQRTCSRCRRRHREGKPLNCTECEQELQRSAEDGTAHEPADAEVAVRSVESGGRPLPSDTRAFFESRFGRDFGDVRVHTGPGADQANRAINAEAFTVGSDIAFARGNYRPGTESGRRLLAHELTHVVQQTGRPATVQRQSSEEQSTSGEETGGVELETWADLWQRGGGMRTVGGTGMYVGTVYFSTDESALDSGDTEALAQLYEQLSRALGRRDGNYTLKAIGYADERGSEQHNLNLSIQRARSVSNYFALLSYYPNFSTETTGFGEFTGEQRGQTAEELAAYRRVDLVLEPPMTRPIRKPEPEQEEQPEEQPECRPAKEGFPPSPANCNAYEQNSWWLPSEYVHNATCACTELPDSPTANCVRAHLQDRMAAVPQSTREYWARVVAVTEGADRMYEYMPFPDMGQEIAEMLIHQELTDLIYEHHVDAYSKCCCKGGPAPYPSWVGVVNVALPCEGVETSIRNFGACGRGGW